MDQQSNVFVMKQPELGKKIAELRQSQGLTQEELVEKCNLNVRTIQRIEAGEVTPRNYTIKAIFDVLGDSLGEWPLESSEGSVDLNKTWLTAGIVAAFLYLFTAIPEGVMDFSRFSGDVFGTEFLAVSAEDGGAFYVLIKLLSMVSFVVFLGAFAHVAVRYKSQLLRAGAVLLGVFTVLFALYDVLSLWISVLDFSNPTIMLLYLTCLGLGSSIFGVGLVSIRSSFGDLSLVAGLVELLIALCLFTVFLSELAIFISIPAVLLEALLLYQVYKKA